MALTAQGQYENVWAFGDKAGLDFNTLPPTPIQTAINTREGSASICDANGQLLFYTDGFSVWDRKHNIMPNGQDLTHSGVSISASTTQGTLIIPKPGSISQYYIFSLGAREAAYPYMGRLYYSVVDMQLNGGLGDIVANAKGLLLDSQLSEHLTAVPGPDCNIWLLSVSYGHITDTILNAYEVSIHGIDHHPVTSPILMGGGEYQGFIGAITASTDFQQIAITRGNLVLYDFDYHSGTASNALQLANSDADLYGVCFSADNSKLYASGTAGLLQFDLSLNTPEQIVDSKTLLSDAYGSIRRGRDGKIYCSNLGQETLHIIQNPSLAGMACRFEEDAISLSSGTKSLLGLPNSVVHRPVRLQTSIMDTTICTTDSFTLTVAIKSGSNYRWIDGFEGSTHSFGASGTYWVRYNAFDLNGCYTVVDTFHVTKVAEWSLLNADTILCEGDTLSIEAVGGEGYTFQWSPSIGVSDPTILNPEITPVDTLTYYTLTASHPDCPDSTVGIRIGMQYAPDVQLGEDKEVCHAEFVPLESVVSPYRSDYTYKWKPAAGLQFNGVAQNYFIADSNITYVLEVSTPIGCTGMDSIHVKVHPDSFAAAIPDTGYCPPQAVPLWATGGTDYRWEPAYGLNDVTIADPVANPQTPTTYTVMVTNDYGCIDSQQVFVDVYPNAVLSMPDTIRIYPGEQYHLEPGTNCHYFNWFPTNGINSTTVGDPIFSPEVRTRYFVTATTEQGCVVRDSIDVLVEETVIDMPNAFAPGKGAIPVFKPALRGLAELTGFSVYNRWGNKVFHTTNIKEGWDGTYNGQPQPVGVYIYQIEAVTNTGKHFRKTGNVTLIR